MTDHNWLSRVLATMGPGLFILGYNIGTGSVTTMSVAGADYGMSLLWTLIFACTFTGVMIAAAGKYTAVTGETLLYAFRRHLHPALAFFLLVATSMSILGGIMGVMGLCAEATTAWVAIMFPAMPHIAPVVPAIGYCVLIYGLFLRGRYATFEKYLAVMVGVMGLSFLASMLLVIPEPMAVLQGMMPRLPAGTGAALVAAGMTGTTLSPPLIIARGIIIQQKGWGVTDLRTQSRDAVISAILMFILCASIMACAAGTMHQQNIQIENAIDMMWSLAPLAGSFAVSIFVLGFVAAGLSSQFPNALYIPWCIQDIRKDTITRMTRWFKVVMAVCVGIGLVVPVFGGRPVLVMLVSQAFNTFSMPLVALLIWRLLNRRDLMGEHTIGLAMNGAILVTFLFSLCMSVLGFIGLSGLL